MGSLPLQYQGETRGDAHRLCVRERRDWMEESQGEQSPRPQHLHSQQSTRQYLVAVPSAVLPVTISSSALPFLWSTTW